MPKSKYSPWSPAAELTLKQAPYQKLRSGYTVSKNKRLRAKIDSDSEAITILAIPKPQ